VRLKTGKGPPKAVQMARKGVKSAAKTQAKRHPAHYLKPVAL